MTSIIISYDSQGNPITYTVTPPSTTPTVTPSASTALIKNTLGAIDDTKSLNSFFPGNTLPATFEAFITAVDGQTAANVDADLTNTGNIPSGFLNEFYHSFPAGILPSETDPSTVSLFKDAFAEFLHNSPTIPTGTTIGTFIGHWQTFMNTVIVPNTVLYKSIFDAFFPNANPNDFAATFSDFISRTPPPGSSGAFSPTNPQFLKTWFSTLTNVYLKGTTGINPSSSISGTDSQKLTVLFDIFRLIVQMIGTLQEATQAQAGRLKFLTTYQQLYTAYIGAVPSFTTSSIQGNSSTGYISNSFDANINTQNISGLNQYNQADIASLQSKRSILQDESKSVQATVSQVNDSVDQQSNIGTTIIQQMTSLLQVMFK